MGAFTKLGTCASGLCAFGSRNGGATGHHAQRGVGGGQVTTPLATVSVERQNQEVRKTGMDLFGGVFI